MSSNPVSWITSLLTVYSILTSRPTANSSLYIHNHLVSAVGSQKLSCLDFSAAFDTIDRDILITRSPASHSGLVKSKVFPYSLPSVGPGADPGVQAVSPQVT